MRNLKAMIVYGLLAFLTWGSFGQTRDSAVELISDDVPLPVVQLTDAVDFTSGRTPQTATVAS